MRISIASVRIILLPQGSKLGPQVIAKRNKIENVCWVKNINDFYVKFDFTCQDHTFAAMMQAGNSRSAQWSIPPPEKNLRGSLFNFTASHQDVIFSSGSSPSTFDQRRINPENRKL